MTITPTPNPYLSAFRWAMLLSLAAAVAYDWATDEMAQMMMLVIALMGLIASGAFLWGAWRVMRAQSAIRNPQLTTLPPWGPTRKMVNAALVEIETAERWNEVERPRNVPPSHW